MNDLKKKQVTLEILHLGIKLTGDKSVVFPELEKLIQASHGNHDTTPRESQRVDIGLADFIKLATSNPLALAAKKAERTRKIAMALAYFNNGEIALKEIPQQIDGNEIIDKPNLTTILKKASEYYYLDAGFGAGRVLRLTNAGRNFTSELINKFLVRDIIQ